MSTETGRTYPSTRSALPTIQKFKDLRDVEKWLTSLLRALNHDPPTRIRYYNPTFTPAAVAGLSAAEQTFTVAGLTTDDKVFINKPSNQANLIIGNARVSADNTLAIMFGNLSGGNITPTSEAYVVMAVREESK